MLLNLSGLERQHEHLIASDPRYQELCSLLEAGGVRWFRFLDQTGQLSRLLLFPVRLSWQLLQAEYLQTLPPLEGSISLCMDTGQRLAPGLLCQDLNHLRGIVTFFVDLVPAASTQPSLPVAILPAPVHESSARPRRKRALFVSNEVLFLFLTLAATTTPDT